MTRQETIDYIIPTQTYIGSAVRKLVNEIILDAKLIPEYLKKGDVIILKNRIKNRPACVIKVMKDYVIVIPMTSSENEHCMSESKSRFFKEGCFCNSYEVVPMELAISNFVAVYDNMKLLNLAITELRVFTSKNI